MRSDSCTACAPIPPGRERGPFLAHKSWNESAPLARSDGAVGYPSYALHDAVKGLNCAWIADHVDAVLAQTLASGAYRALKRVCLGQARRLRKRNRSRRISSVENQR